MLRRLPGWRTMPGWTSWSCRRRHSATDSTWLRPSRLRRRPRAGRPSRSSRPVGCRPTWPNGGGLESDPVHSTTVLLSSRLGEYRQVQGPTDTGFGAVRLEPADGDGPVIVGVHTYPPVSGAMAWGRSSVADVASLCSHPPAGLIVAGDLDATRDHAPLQDLGGCASAGEQAGVGGLATWPTATGTRWLGTTIDHVLVDDGAWRGSNGRVVTVPGTDHRAVVVQLAGR